MCEEGLFGFSAVREQPQKDPPSIRLKMFSVGIVIEMGYFANFF